MKKRKETKEEKCALELFYRLMPNWQGSFMIFNVQIDTNGTYRTVVIPGGDIYQIILKAVKNSD